MGFLQLQLKWPLLCILEGAALINYSQYPSNFQPPGSIRLYHTWREPVPQSVKHSPIPLLSLRIPPCSCFSWPSEVLQLRISDRAGSLGHSSLFGFGGAFSV